MDAIVQQ